MLIRKIKFIVLFILVFASIQINAQTRVSSPYSRYGIGDLQLNSQAWSMSMGGIGLAYRNPNTVNFSNPASYTAFDTTSFVFETNVVSNFSELTTSSLSQKSNYTTLGYMLFGFRVNRWWAASIGLLPYSNVGYKISDEESIANIGRIDYLYQGYGGINRFYIGNSFKLFKNLSIGFNSSYLFGTLNKIRTASFPDSANYFSTKITNITNVNDFLFNYGLQFNHKIVKDLSVNIGLVFGNSQKINVHNDTLAETVISANGYDYVKDTVKYVVGNKGHLLIPQNIGGGIMICKGEQFLLGVDYMTQNWSDYTSFENRDSLKNSSQLSIGGQFIPKNPNTIGKTSYFNRINYRLGYRYSKTYLQLHNNQLTEQAICIGFGFPLKRTKSTINLGVEYGTRGSTEQNLIEERFIKVSLSFGIKEWWFVRHKYD